MKNKLLFLLLLLFATKIYSKGIDLVAPLNDFSSPTFKVNFIWNPITSQPTYRIKIAQDSGFNSIIKDLTLSQTSILITFSTSVAAVYWKVITGGANGHVESDVYRLNFINPTQNPNLLLWLAADSNVVMNPDSTISAWNNIVQNGINAIQSLSNAQPKLVTNISEINNQKAIKFDGVDDFFKVNSGGLVGSAYTVCNWQGGAAFSNYNGILTKQSISGFDDYIIMAEPGKTSLFANNYFTRNGVANVNNGTLSFLPNFNSHKMIAARRVNQIVNISNFNIGKEPDFSAVWNGNMAEIILSKSNTTTEADSIQTYLGNKYAPPLVLKDTVIGTSLCTSVAISAPGNYTNYLWSTGSTAQTIITIPNKTLTLTTKDVFGKVSTTIFNVYPYVRLNNITVNICQGDTFKLDLKTPAGFTALWNTGNATTKINITTAGRYTVRITDAGGICFVDDTINVIVDKPELIPSPISGTLLICKNEKLFLTTPTSFDSIRWSTGSAGTFIPITLPGTYSVYGRNSTGCIINQSFNVTIAGNAPTANFGYTSVCQNNSTKFTDSSVTNGGNITVWKWSLGNGNSSSQQNPTNIYAATGSFSVGLKITTNQGCSDSIGKIIVVNKKPVAQFSNRRSCEGNPTTFEDLSNPNAASITNWNWNFAGLGIINDIQNPSFAFPAANTYSVKLVVTNINGCVDSATNSVKVNQSPIANFSFDSACGKTPINFKFLATVPPSPTPPQPTITTWNWDFGDNTSEPSIKDVTHPYATPGTYNVKLSVNSSDQCPNTIEKQVKVFDFPVVDFDVSATQCAGKDIQFTDISQTLDGTPITSWKWYFSGQSTAITQNASYAFSTAGNYTIQLTAANAVGCSDTKLRSIAVSALPVPKFTFSPQNGLPPLIVNYTNLSPNTGNYIWDYGDNSGLINGFNPPSHTYTTIGTYPIKLIATNFRGCTDTLTKSILVDKAFIDGVMTSITIIPNGDYYQIQAIILNASNIEIRDLGLNLQIGGGSVIREDWTGSLLPGQSTTYNFTGQIRISENSIPVICASIDNVNNYAAENKTDNNTYCKEVKVGSFDVLNIYPNPAYETINFGIMLPKDGKVTVGFVDMLGQTMYKKEFDGNRGYNNLTMSTMQLNAAVYVAVVTFDGEIIRSKFMRRDRK